MGAALEVFVLFLRLGLTSFGGPVAHLAFFRAEFVERRKWLSEAAYADIVALCQFLPGPTSSQVGLALGFGRAGFAGGLAAWLGFTAPSAAAMIAFANGVGARGDLSRLAWLHGLKVVAVAVVAQAIESMARSLCPDRPRAGLAVAAALFVLALPSAAGQIAAIVAAGIFGWRFLADAASRTPSAPLATSLPRAAALSALAIFVLLLVGLPLAATSGAPWVKLFASFYRSGALVFGGGHVVLPLLREAVATQGWIGDDAFLAGYGAAQALPGPLFAFAAFLGAAMNSEPRGIFGALLCLTAIYLPSFLLLVGVLPFWDRLRRAERVQAALRGVNAAVVGLLAATFVTPVCTSAIFSVADFALAAVAYTLLTFVRAPPGLVVAFGALAAMALAESG